VSRALRWLARGARRSAVFLAGAALMLAGLAMLFLPGPGIATVLLGLALLATEFQWARRLLTWARRRARELADRARGRSPAAAATRRPEPADRGSARPGGGAAGQRGHQRDH
jgi:uncharacterized protein (TIGR02611 family)